jgi:hypothetical protein
MQDKFISVTTNSFSSPYGLDKKQNDERYLINSSEIRYIREQEDGKLIMSLKGETVIEINEKFDKIQSMLIKPEAEGELLELVSGQNEMTIDTRVDITNTNLKRVLCDIPSHESTPFGLFNRLIVDDTNFPLYEFKVGGKMCDFNIRDSPVIGRCFDLKITEEGLIGTVCCSNHDDILGFRVYYQEDYDNGGTLKVRYVIALTN